jgi:preprotein translocase subunit SecA
MLKKFVTIFGGDPNKRELEKFIPLVEQINDLEADYEKLSDKELREKTDVFKGRLAEGETLEELLPEAFATVREASKRTIGLRHYDVQIIGGIVLHQGKIAEMRTGEGKTLVATLPLYLNALTGRGTHLITVNDYLARRDARWMAPIYDLLGISVGVLQMASRTENGKKAFIVDLEHESPHEDQHQLRLVPRQEAYAVDVTYGTNSEFGFDYLRDNMTMRMDERVQRGHYYAIIDEVDNVLIDEARTPLIISGPASEDVEWFTRMAQLVKALRPEDYEVSERDRNVTLTEIGEVHVEELLGMPLGDPERPEDVTLEQARLLGYLEQALRAQYLFKRNKDYIVQAGKVIIVDEFTGRLMPGRRWSDGLHQAVEAKEGVHVQPENVTYATITIQNYFRMYEKLSGMSGTALTEAEEFDKIYKLGVVAIPTNLEYSASLPESGLVELENKDEQGYKYLFYAGVDDNEKTPVFWKRKDYPDVVYRTEEAKLRAIMQEILCYYVIGRPLLVGTTSVELSERVSNRLRAEPLRRLTQTLLLRHVWFEKNKREEDGRAVEELKFLNSPIDQLDISLMRKLARELDMSFNPEEPANLERLTDILELVPSERERLASALQAGIPHQVLNARKHTEESQIITGAGAFGAVTIATNMAGRGVDIKLGGDLNEQILASINRILYRSGYENAYDMTLEARREAILDMNPEDYGIYEADVQAFLRYMEEMETVRTLGGLHVIGSERHEARRIDNQLRGRSARQGDPGSSRFYLSMEDELMRLFGGEQADGLMQRMKIDDALPLEIGLVGRLIEQSQSRVEGSNFDVRKHLLEYDDVLNAQREKIYSQRDRIFTKDDLSEDVTDMLRSEINRRVPESLEDDEGPWKLLAWLDQVQPTLVFDSRLFPSYSLRLLIDHILQKYTGKSEGEVSLDPQIAKKALLEVAQESLISEEEHIVKTVSMLIDQAEMRLSSQIDERIEAVDTFFEGLLLEEEGEVRSSRQLLDELSSATRLPIRLSNEEQRLLRDEPNEVLDEVRNQVRSTLFNHAVIRLIGAVERRVEDHLDLDGNQVKSEEWDDLSSNILNALQSMFESRRERLIGNGNGSTAEGQITRDLDNAIEQANGSIDRFALHELLMMMPQGAHTTFDKHTHRRVQIRVTRLMYTYYVAGLLQGKEVAEVTEDVLDHLELAQENIKLALGSVEWSRLSQLSLTDMEEGTRLALEDALGEIDQEWMDKPLHTLPPKYQAVLISDLGRQALTIIYRQLMLAVITELWVEYLTQMEALRVSIGLEAYAQRDPLVQYKNKASELFQELLANMRSGVISRMFTYRPRDLGNSPNVTPRNPPPVIQAPETEKIETTLPTADAKQNRAEVANGSKKRRRRKRH